MSDQVTQLALVLTTRSGPGVLHAVTGIIAAHGGDITTLTIVENARDVTRLLLEVTVADGDGAAGRFVCG